jgi:hypothetical protein
MHGRIVRLLHRYMSFVLTKSCRTVCYIAWSYWAPKSSPAPITNVMYRLCSQLMCRVTCLIFICSIVGICLFHVVWADSASHRVMNQQCPSTVVNLVILSCWQTLGNYLANCQRILLDTVQQFELASEALFQAS